jgi:hypothetical protein
MARIIQHTHPRTHAHLCVSLTISAKVLGLALLLARRCRSTSTRFRTHRGHGRSRPSSCGHDISTRLAHCQARGGSRSPVASPLAQQGRRLKPVLTHKNTCTRLTNQLVFNVRWWRALAASSLSARWLRRSWPRLFVVVCTTYKGVVVSGWR